jgi:hypothetical protein
MDFNDAAATVIVVEPVSPASAALIVVVPAAKAEAKPPDEIVATAVFDDAQVTWLVRSPVVLSANVPVAVNCCVAPIATDGFAGVTPIDWSVLTTAVVLTSLAFGSCEPGTAIITLIVNVPGLV